jgi:ABC-2 type transport system permease protein
MLISSLIKFPLIFISGVFVPIDQMGNLKVLAYFSPLTYYTDLARYSIEKSSQFSPCLSLTILSIFTVFLFAISLTWHKKSLSKRF